MNKAINLITRRNALLNLAAVTPFVASQTATPVKPKMQDKNTSITTLTAPAPNGLTTLLFFDDEPLFIRNNITRRLGTTKRLSAYHEELGNCTWGYPGVFICDDGKWRMVYQAGVNHPGVKKKGGGGIFLLAESPDGQNWKPQVTENEIDIPSRVAPHQILPDDGSLFSGVFEDPWPATPKERYKLLSSNEPKGETKLWTSADLVHWVRAEAKGWQKEAPDPPSFPFWNAVRSCYLIATRPGPTDRRICFTETRDWKSFTPRQLVLQADAEDQPLAQLYGMYVLPYDGYYIGALWLYYAGNATPSPSVPSYLYYGGKQETYLSYSINGDHWQRCMHEPLFRNGQPGEPDAGCLQVSNITRAKDGSLRCYASCSSLEHGNVPESDGYIVTYELRKDGFVCLEAGPTVGRISTRALYWEGGEAELNLDAKGGLARVRVVKANGEELPGFGFGDCIPLSDADSIAWTPQWKSGNSLQNLAGTMVRIEVEMTSARIYALRGNFILSRWHEVRTLKETNTPPSKKMGL